MPYPNRMEPEFSKEVDEANTRANGKACMGGPGPFVARHWMEEDEHRWQATPWSA